MANGLLGKASLTANANTAVYTPTTSKTGIVSVSICNRTASGATIRLAIIAAANSAPTDAEYLEFGSSIPANGVLERSGLALNDSNKLIIWTDSSGVSALVYGLEQNI